MLRYTETPDKIIVFFTETRIRDESEMQDAGKRLFELCSRAASGGKKLTVDLRGVQFMSVHMLGKLVLLNKIAKDKGVNFRMANAGPTIMELFRMMHLNEVFRLDDGDDDPDLLGSEAAN